MSWFGEFLRQELAPYPGRVSQVSRMVAAVTLAMLVVETFHLPSGILGVFYALLISRESLSSTAQQTWLVIAVFSLSTAYVLLSVTMLLDSPVTHFLWVIGSFYLIFFLMGTARNYQLATGFAFVIASSIPLWDRPGNVNIKTALTLYTLLSVVIGGLSVFVVEFVYRAFHPRSPVLEGIADRLHVVSVLVRSFGREQPPPPNAAARLNQYALVGPSALRRALIRAGDPPEVRARATAVVAMSGRLVELAGASLNRARSDSLPTLSDSERARCRDLGLELERLAATLRGHSSVREIGIGGLPMWAGPEQPSSAVPLLPEMERSVRAMSEIASAFGQVRHTGPERPAPDRQVRGQLRTVLRMLGAHPSEILVADAFSNPAHQVFALRGCLAATLCYLIYNGVDWPGINTSVATCIVTALGTIGSSRQKQLLRFTGAFVGGFVIALPAQIFLLPLMNSISAFTLFFMVVSAFAAWISTASPRLSYFGVQVAFAFYLVNVQEPFEQISLGVARDRVIGVLLGLTAMWITFERIRPARAAEQMTSLLNHNLILLSDLAGTIADASRFPATQVTQRFRHLQERINDTFSQMNAQADAVQFEWGRRRPAQMRARDRMQAMQPPMRSLFLLQTTLFDFEPPSIHAHGGSNRETARKQIARQEETDEPLSQFLESTQNILRMLAANREDAAEAMLSQARSVQANVGGRVSSSLTAAMISALTALEQAATAATEP